MKTYTLLNLFKEKELLPYIKKFKNSSNLTAFDLGCGSGIALYFLFQDYEFKKLIGVDIKSEQAIVEKFISENPDKKHLTTVHKICTTCLKFSEDEIKEGKTHLDPIEFKDKINIHFNTDVFNFIRNNSFECDFLNMENFFHFKDVYDFKPVLFLLLIKFLKPGTLIHIKIYTQESAKLKNLEHPNSYAEISEYEFLNILSAGFNQVYFNPNIKTGFKSNNIDLSSMVYVGVVK